MDLREERDNAMIGFMVVYLRCWISGSAARKAEEGGGKIFQRMYLDECIRRCSAMETTEMLFIPNWKNSNDVTRAATPRLPVWLVFPAWWLWTLDWVFACDSASVSF